MKRHQWLWMLLTLLIFFSSCTSEELKKEKSEENPADTLEEEYTRVESEENGQTEDEKPYESIPARALQDDQWKTVRIRAGERQVGLQLDVPMDWEFVKEDEGNLKILYNGGVIGEVSTAPLSEPERVFEVSERKSNVTPAKRQVELHTENDRERYYRSFSFSCLNGGEDYSVNLRVDYSHLNNEDARTLLQSGTTLSAGSQFLSPSKIRNSQNILILGNSFISTSKIGSFLDSMLTSGNTGCQVKAVSIGMAEVSTYAKETQYLNDIRSGKYCYMFLCGFYSMDASAEMDAILSVCRESDTLLVIFPAHNESDTAVDFAVSAHPDVLFLDWKGEIERLIAEGIPKSSMCIDDSYKHSTPLAGYVGANLIYRSLFGTPPPKLRNAPLTQSEVESGLRGYVENGGKTMLESQNTFVIR